MGARNFNTERKPKLYINSIHLDKTTTRNKKNYPKRLDGSIKEDSRSLTRSNRQFLELLGYKILI